MSTMDQRYLNHFTPLVQEFLQEVDSLSHPNIEKMPQPFLPLFGTNYATSAFRLMIIGQDTYWWHDLRDFLAAEKANPGSKLVETLQSFRAHQFTGWGNSRQHFWGFAMMLLATLHGHEDWQAMKQGKMTEILDSFAWSNGNAVELYNSTAGKLAVPVSYWNVIRQAGERFNRFRHIQETLQPQAVVVMYRGINMSTYFEGYRLEEISRNQRLIHYRLPDVGVDVFHVPHPRSMNYREGTDHFRDKLKELFIQHGFTTIFDKFLSGQKAGNKSMEYLRAKAPVITESFDKYQFVSWVAEELAKRDSFMSVPALMDLVNANGGETDYGEPFTGGRGSYRLVSGAYHRLENAGQKERARSVAVAFRRPNFEYAYGQD